eukprot:XP_001707754.1 Hypothetical protein GL50803_32339 [Giardia lamblia ATCC 50803]
MGRLSQESSGGILAKTCRRMLTFMQLLSPSTHTFSPMSIETNASVICWDPTLSILGCFVRTRKSEVTGRPSRLESLSTIKGITQTLSGKILRYCPEQTPL